jgi:hypothetical protein
MFSEAHPLPKNLLPVDRLLVAPGSGHEIRACTEVTRLERWLVAAVTVASVPELLATSTKPRRPRR